MSEWTTPSRSSSIMITGWRTRSRRRVSCSTRSSRAGTAHAPKIQFKTTGGGRWRANPNLYKDGKVPLAARDLAGRARRGTPRCPRCCKSSCRSSPNPVPQPYFNEPGFERLIGTPEGRSRGPIRRRRGEHAAVGDDRVAWVSHPAFRRHQGALGCKGSPAGSRQGSVDRGRDGERKARLDGCSRSSSMSSEAVTGLTCDGKGDDATGGRYDSRRDEQRQWTN